MADYADEGMTTTADWTDQEVLQFISYYEEKTFLWHTKHPDHFSKVHRSEAWIEIAEKTGRPVEECKKKMNSLQASMRREKVKMKRRLGTWKGSDEVYKSSWYAFKSLLFLWEKDPKPREKTTTSSAVVPARIRKAPKRIPPQDPPISPPEDSPDDEDENSRPSPTKRLRSEDDRPDDGHVLEKASPNTEAAKQKILDKQETDDVQEAYWNLFLQKVAKDCKRIHPVFHSYFQMEITSLVQRLTKATDEGRLSCSFDLFPSLRHTFQEMQEQPATASDSHPEKSASWNSLLS